MNISQEKLEERLIPVLVKLKDDRKFIKEISNDLIENNIFEGDIVRVFLHPETIYTIDNRFICLLIRSIYLNATLNNIENEFGIENLNFKEIFTDSEIKESLRYKHNMSINNDEPILPVTIENVIQVRYDSFVFRLDYKTIINWLNNDVIYYDFDLQREATLVQKGNEIIKQPTVNQNSTKEIADYVENDDLYDTMLSFNAMIGTGINGEEIKFDPRKNTLTILEGTRLAVIDGFHRLTGIKLALSKKPEKNDYMLVKITNYPLEKAEKYLGQIAKSNIINKTRSESLLKERLADDVVAFLIKESDLKGRVSPINRLRKLTNEIVTYDVLADTIESEFKIKNKYEATKVGRYLAEFFNNLLGIYSNEFTDNIEETRKNSLINNNNMFVVYVIIAKQLYEKNIQPDFDVIDKIISGINFNYDNPLWTDLQLVKNGKLNVSSRDKAVRKRMKSYFRNKDFCERIKTTV